jgi:hypothetical protein
VPNIWLRPNNQRREADAAKARLTVPDGDHLTLLNVYNQYRLQSESASLNKKLFVNILELTGFYLFLVLIYKVTRMAKIGHGKITFHYVPFNKRIMFALSYSGRWNVSKLNSSLWQMNKNFS